MAAVVEWGVKEGGEVNRGWRVNALGVDPKP